MVRLEPGDCLVCAFCGSTNFPRRTGSAARARQYCSAVCYQKSNRGKPLSNRHIAAISRALSTRILRHCAVCGVEFLAKPSQISKGDGKFCSRRCYGVSQRGICKPKCGVRPEGFVVYNKGKPHKQETIEKIRKLALTRQAIRYAAKPTYLEKMLYDALKRAGENFVIQEQIGPFLVDAYLPEARTAIEIDGEWWHALPRTIEKDRREAAFMQKIGIRLVRVPERGVLASGICAALAAALR